MFLESLILKLHHSHLARRELNREFHFQRLKTIDILSDFTLVHVSLRDKAQLCSNRSDHLISPVMKRDTVYLDPNGDECREGR